MIAIAEGRIVNFLMTIAERMAACLADYQDQEWIGTGRGMTVDKEVTCGDIGNKNVCVQIHAKF